MIDMTTAVQKPDTVKLLDGVEYQIEPVTGELLELLVGIEMDTDTPDAGVRLYELVNEHLVPTAPRKEIMRLPVEALQLVIQAAREPLRVAEKAAGKATPASQ